MYRKILNNISSSLVYCCLKNYPTETMKEHNRIRKRSDFLLFFIQNPEVKREKETDGQGKE